MTMMRRTLRVCCVPEQAVLQGPYATRDAAYP
jgi:hypothetical protein